MADLEDECYHIPAGNHVVCLEADKRGDGARLLVNGKPRVIIGKCKAITFDMSLGGTRIDDNRGYTVPPMRWGDQG
jgi:hypothetical protein